MTISIACPNCGHPREYPEARLGSTVTCSRCTHPVPIPTPRESPARSPAAVDAPPPPPGPLVECVPAETTESPTRRSSGTARVPSRTGSGLERWSAHLATGAISATLVVLIFVAVSGSDRSERERNGLSLPIPTLSPVSDASEEPRGREAPRSEMREPTDRGVPIGESVRLGGIEITVLDLRLRRVTATQRSFEGTTRIESKEEKLVLGVRIENISEGMMIRPVTNETLFACRLNDNFDNSIESFGPPVLGDDLQFDGQDTGVIAPGAFMESIVMADRPPVARATSFQWVLYFEPDNRNDFDVLMPSEKCAVYVRFTANQIRRE